MSTTVLPQRKTIGNSDLDYHRFETLSQEALRLIRNRKVRCNANGHSEVLQNSVEEIKDTINDRLSTSQQ